MRSSDGQYHVCVWQPDENVYSEPAANADAIEADVLQLARANQRRGFAAAAVALKCTQPLMRAVAEGPEGVFADAALAALVAGMRATGTGEGEMERVRTGVRERVHCMRMGGEGWASRAHFGLVD